MTAIDGGLIRMEAAAPRVSIVSDDAVTSVGAARARAMAWMAVRPEKVRISHDAPIDRRVNAGPWQVWDCGYIGDTSVYQQPTMAAPSALPPSPTSAARWNGRSAGTHRVCSSGRRRRCGSDRREGDRRMSTEKSRSGRFLPVGIPYVWMLVFFLVPFLIVVAKISSTSVMALPPYAPVVESLTDLCGAEDRRILLLQLSQAGAGEHLCESYLQPVDRLPRTVSGGDHAGSFIRSPTHGAAPKAGGRRC